MRTIVAAAIFAVCAATAFAQPGHGMGMGPGPGADRPGMGGRQRMLADLNLTEEQQAKVEKMRIDLQKKMAVIQSKVRVAELEMQELYNAPEVDRNAIEKKMKEISDLRLQQRLSHLDHQFAVKGILTAEQQKIWKQHLKSAGEGRQIRRQRFERMFDRDDDEEVGPEIERRIERRIEKKVE